MVRILTSPQRLIQEKCYDSNAIIGHLLDIIVPATLLFILYWLIKPWKVDTFGENVLGNISVLGIVISAMGAMLVIPPFVLPVRSTDVRTESKSLFILTFGPSIGVGCFLGTFITMLSDPKPDTHLMIAMVMTFAFSAFSVAMAFWYMGAMSRTYQRVTIDGGANLFARLPFLGHIARDLFTRRRPTVIDSLMKVWLVPSADEDLEERDRIIIEHIAEVCDFYHPTLREKIRQGLWENWESYTFRRPWPTTPDGKVITERLDKMIKLLEGEST